MTRSSRKAKVREEPRASARPEERTSIAENGEGGEGAETSARATFITWRAALVALVLCSMFGAVMARAYHIQVGRAHDLGLEAASQLAGVVEIRARRGAVYDRNGDEMAISVRAESLFARPGRVTSPRETAATLAPLLEMSELALFDMLTQERNFVWLSRRVSPRLADQIRSLELPGIDSMSEWQRFYPMRHRAGHLLGFTGDDGYGLEGVERAHEETLAGGAMEVRGLRDALGRPILTMESPELQAMEGASVVLTLDARLQRIAERELERVVVDEQARTGAIVVMDPHTGEILAMTNWPLFDPNRFRVSRPQYWRNRSVTDAWEPGSTMKIFTYAAGLEAGVIAPGTPIDAGGGRIRIGRHRIRDHSHAPELSAAEVIQVSSNIGTYRIAAMLGDEALYDWFHQFGFGEQTGSGLGGEQRGILAGPPWAEIELANRAFGQGLTTTPLQLALAYSALANGGELMRPMLVREIRNKDGDVLERFEPEVRRRVISERTARQATQALESVTQGEGTGVLACIPGIRVAGKTGTAQKVNPETGEYDDIWMVSFIGYVPADDPQFTIAVLVDEPQVGVFGGDVAAPVFARVAEQALATRGVFSTRTGDSEDDAESGTDVAPRAEGVTTEPDAELMPLDLSPLPSTVAGRPARVIVPDLRGFDLVEVLRHVEEIGLAVEVHEWGAVQRQWPAAGASVLEGTRIDVYMSAPYDLDGAAFEVASP